MVLKLKKMPTQKKLSAYQKLKQQNLALMQDIHTLIMEKDFLKVHTVKMRYQTKFYFENAVWSGSRTQSESEIIEVEILEGGLKAKEVMPLGTGTPARLFDIFASGYEHTTIITPPHEWGGSFTVGKKFKAEIMLPGKIKILLHHE